MNWPRRALTAVMAAMLAPVLPAISACAPIARTCGGQCGPPFQLQVDFRHGTSRQEAIAGMRKCQADPLVIRIGQPYRSHAPGTPGQWTAIIYTKKMPIGPGPVPLLTCLHHSPAVAMASWPD